MDSYDLVAFENPKEDLDSKARSVSSRVLLAQGLLRAWLEVRIVLGLGVVLMELMVWLQTDLYFLNKGHALALQP